MSPADLSGDPAPATEAVVDLPAIGGGIYGGGVAREVDDTVDQVRASRAEDVLYRRGKCGLMIGASAALRLARHLATRTR